jgi:hypothetical protein
MLMMLIAVVLFMAAFAPQAQAAAGNAAEFTKDSNSYISVPSSAELKTFSALTLEAWIKPTGTSGEWSLIAGKQLNGADANPWYSYRLCKSNFGSFPDTVNFQIAPVSIGVETGATSTTVVQNDVWTHIAGVYDGTTIKIYVNGELESTVAQTGDLKESDFNLYIGKAPWTNNNNFNGQMDELRVWNVARTQGQIQETMYSSLSGSENGLVAYWPFNDAAGSGTTDDASQNNNTGTLNNGAAIVANSTVPHTVELPQTGQTTCYDASGNVIACANTGQDGDKQAGVAWPDPRFTDNGDGTVTDTLTGLVWLKNANCFGTRTWTTALNDANNLANGACGLSDGSTAGQWRLPNVNELESLTHAEEANSATWLNTQGFPTAQSDWYWSSTTCAGRTGFAWVVNMWGGDVGLVDKDDLGVNFYVWPVRAGATVSTVELPKTGQTTCYDAAGGVIACANTGQDGDKLEGVAWPSPRFTDNGNGTVTDNLTGLVWLKNANCFGTMNWTTALNGANTLASGSCGLSDGSTAGDWRLPNRKELRSLIDYSRANLALPNGHPFTNAQSDWYWSSTTLAGHTDYAWYVYMWFGYVYFDRKDTNGYVWPVRSGSGGSLYNLAISKDGTGTGTVTSDPAGIDCGGTCNADFADGTEVTLTATPAAGSTFAGWSGDADCSDGVVTMDSAKSCTATFNLIQRTLTVTGTGSNSTGNVTGGQTINCDIAANGAVSGTCSEIRDTGAAIALTATPAANTTVTWTNCDVAAGNSCSLTLNADKTINAQFTLNQYTITVTQTAGGTIVCNPTTVNHGSNSNCTITPNADYSINTVTVDGASQGAITTYQFSNVTANHTITATYTYNPPPAPEPEPEPQPQPQPQPEPQVINSNNPSINYGNGWQGVTNPNAASGSLMIGHNAGGGAGLAVSYAFTGSSIQWRAMTHPQGGSARVYIDGVYMGIVNLNSSGTSYDATVFNWSGSSGQHTIRIVPMPSLPGFTVNIDRFIVQ